MSSGLTHKVGIAHDSRDWCLKEPAQGDVIAGYEREVMAKAQLF